MFPLGFLSLLADLLGLYVIIQAARNPPGWETQLRLNNNETNTISFVRTKFNTDSIKIYMQFCAQVITSESIIDKMINKMSLRFVNFNQHILPAHLFY